eukprot:CAMPEP_0179328312 /NCGR_PEP_ID=MMETSP0797-20121207/62449_1 /TAXON_ID=47934 /ORGANISM="Dinophysis acuminata, Strain DAEP01" /LENGTH=44 /DNA_ID= /DNA_START= /DNA_END= /DNA_ORIENTATION=
MEAQLRELENRVANLERGADGGEGAGDDGGLVPGRKSGGSDAQV